MEVPLEVGFEAEVVACVVPGENSVGLVIGLPVGLPVAAETNDLVDWEPGVVIPGFVGLVVVWEDGFVFLLIFKFQMRNNILLVNITIIKIFVSKIIKFSNTAA